MLFWTGIATQRVTRWIQVAAILSVCMALLPSRALATTWDRLAGSDAYDTMQQVVAAEGSFEPDQVDSVVLATGDGYWDALAASGLAGLTGAPVLITPSGRLSDQARAEIERLTPSRVLIMGGRSSVADSVEAEVEELCDDVRRVSGPAAPDTAVAAWYEGVGWSSTAIVATANGYWDALSIAPYAYANKAPIFLTEAGNRLGESALIALREGGFSRVIIVGGPAVVSLEVEDQLAGIAVTRLAGIDAIGTSAAIACWEIDEGMGVEGLCVATSNGYWDALTGAAFAGKNRSVLVLANADAYGAIDAALDKVWGASPASGHVLGGNAAVPEPVLTYLRNEAGTRPAILAVDPNPASDAAAAIRRSLNIQTALFESFAHGDKGARYQKYIMLHDTEEMSGPWGIVDLWRRRNNQQVATHFVVGRDGSIVQCVPLDQIAYHAGGTSKGSNARFGIVEDGRDGVQGSGRYDRAMNSWSVGIEICHVGTTGTGYEIEPDYPAAQLEALDRLIAYIDAYYGFQSPIIQHKDWALGNPDCSVEFDRYFANYQQTRTHDGS